MGRARPFVSVVTGGAGGIGKAIVERLVQRGDTVIIFDCIPLDDPRVGWCRQTCEYVSIDISSHSAVHKACAALVKRYTAIDLLVNNAGITGDSLAVRLNPLLWKKVLSVNLDGAFWCTQAVLPAMMRQRSGCIITISSVVAHTGNPGQVAYSASKSGLEAMTKTIAREYGARGIRANGIAPGLIQTGLTERLPAKVYDEAIARTSMKRAGRPEEVAELVIFLSSEQSSYITGQIIHINGGMW